MNQVSSRSLYLLAGLVLIFSSTVFFINCFGYNYPGNNYFPEGVPLLILILILFNLGLALYFETDNKLRQIGRELIYFFAVMSLIAFTTNAVQLTPFPTIDRSIITLEKYFHINMKAILIWTNDHHQLKYVLGVIYDILTLQMTILPLLIIVTCRFHLIREYYFHLLCTTLIGFGFYYFFPTTAPASVIHSSLFSPEQLDTGIKFRQIHHYIHPSTIDGGLIAFPSFHTIWAILCVNLLREWIVSCVLLLINNLLLIASCVLLGWHYLSDIIGAFILLFISYCLLKYLRPTS